MAFITYVCVYVTQALTVNELEDQFYMQSMGPNDTWWVEHNKLLTILAPCHSSKLVDMTFDLEIERESIVISLYQIHYIIGLGHHNDIM